MSAGSVRSRIVATRCAALARRTGSRWDDAVVEAVARRVPFWSLLIGVYVAAGFWTLTPNFATALDKALYVVAAASLTFLVSEVLVKLVRIARAGARPVAADDDAHREHRSGSSSSSSGCSSFSTGWAWRSRRC